MLKFALITPRIVRRMAKMKGYSEIRFAHNYKEANDITNEYRSKGYVLWSLTYSWDYGDEPIRMEFIMPLV